MKQSPGVYSLPADNFTKALTGFVVLGTAFAIFVCSLISGLVGLVVAVLLISILVITYLYSPNKVILKKDKIVIERVLGSVEIPYAKIKEISFVAKPKMLRLFGSGGLFGYFGLFRFEGKTVRVYARRLKDFVLIKADETYLIAPNNPDEFMHSVQSLKR